ncbi:MAG: sigma-70 family RNA polymerase sigma factor [Myxococcota bacterium]
MSSAEEATRDLLQRGRAAWPNVELGAHAGGFADFVRARLDGDVELHEDLFVAYACSVGIDAASRRFEAAYRPLLELTHATWRGPSPDLHDFMQSVYERTLVGSPPRIASYRGRGPLRAWVKMVAVRRLADLAQRSRRNAADPSSDALVAALLPGLDLARELTKQRHAPEVEAALRSAFEHLDPSQRILLRQRFLHGLSLAELAGLMGVHRVTVSKRLARVRAQVLEALESNLAGTLAKPDDARTIARMCLSQLDVSLETLLRSRSQLDMDDETKHA